MHLKEMIIFILKIHDGNITFGKYKYFKEKSLRILHNEECDYKYLD